MEVRIEAIRTSIAVPFRAVPAFMTAARHIQCTRRLLPSISRRDVSSALNLERLSSRPIEHLFNIHYCA
jgi:hypothetical protein